MARKPSSDPLIISYLTLRRLIGWIAVLLPPVLLASSLISSSRTDIYVSKAIAVSSKFPDSVSGYYYTGMRNVFVGSLCALGVFLMGYNGYDDLDRWTTTIAGAFALGVAFFPTAPSIANPSSSQQAIGTAHLTFAGLLFTLMAFMALRFAKTYPGDEPKTRLRRVRAGLGFENTWPDEHVNEYHGWERIRTDLGFGKSDSPQIRRKKRRNVVYRMCAFAILLSMGLAILSNYLPVAVKKITPTLFWFETIAILAFGVSWFVKGRSLLPVRRRQIMRQTQPLRPVNTLDSTLEEQLKHNNEFAAGVRPTIDQMVAHRVANGEATRVIASDLHTSPQRVSELTAELS